MNQRLPSGDAVDSPTFKQLHLLGCLAAVSLLLLGSGCSTSEMKGTPFYTGEYNKRPGAAEQRVNVWPLLYYREPALSVVWPIFELADDHTAVRPLFSVYGLDQPKHEYNFLWPLAQFDQRTEANRIFPLFWGDDYRVLFPLYWHFGQPWGEQEGSDTLFPLWHYSRKGTERFNLYSPWPLVRFWADQKNDVRGSMVLPLYYHRTQDTASQFYSLLWCDDHKSDGDFWRMLFPLYFESQLDDHASFVTPLWQQGNSGDDAWRSMLPFWFYSSDGEQSFDLSAPWPLVRFWSDEEKDDHGSRVLPLYWHEQEAGRSQFFSLPWSSGSDADSYWRFVPPLFYQSSNATDSIAIALLYAQGRDDATDWNTFFPLWYRSHEGTNRFNFYSLPAYFWADRRADERGSVVFPLYWHQFARGSSQFNSLLWMNHSEANGDFWQLLPPLFYRDSTSAGSRLITPLWAQGRTATNEWSWLVPLVYWDTQQHTLLSPFWAHWRTADTETWLAPWTLSWLTRNPQHHDLTLLGGLARTSWGEQPSADYFFPLYYNDALSGTVLSPLWLQWREAETETTIAPWLLSWRTREPERTDLWLAGGLARASWGEKPGADYVFPLFYHDTNSLFTPLLGWDEETDFMYYATPLAGVRTGEHAGSWLFPLYYHSRVKTTGEVKANYLLLGSHTRTKEVSRSWFIPLFYHENQFVPEASAAPSTNRYQTYGQNFWCLPVCWYRNECYLRPIRNHDNPTTEVASTAGRASATTDGPVVRDYTRAHGMFPLWDYESHATPAEGRSNQEGSLLLWLYDYKHDFGPLPGTRASVTNDYTRSRVLWRLWHYEKLNGDVSVDVFPSFTYDRKTDGFKKISFLWRFFRYERGADGETKLDALFVPLKR
jgi:hypothetical protein